MLNDPLVEEVVKLAEDPGLGLLGVQEGGRDEVKGHQHKQQYRHEHKGPLDDGGPDTPHEGARYHHALAEVVPVILDRAEGQEDQENEERHKPVGVRFRVPFGDLERVKGREDSLAKVVGKLLFGGAVGEVEGR